MGLFRKSRATDEVRAITRSPFEGVDVPTVAGVEVGQESALRLSAVYSCVSLIADGVAALPVDTFRKVKGQRIETDAPAWLKSPNPFMTPFEFWHSVMLSLLLDGNAFVSVVRAPDGRIVALVPLAPATVNVRANETQTDVEFVIGDDVFTREHIVHVAAFRQPGRLRGLSPIEQARQAIGLGLVTEQFGAQFFSKGTTMSGVITHPGSPNMDEGRLLKETFRKTNGGLANAHAVGVLTGGATFTPITVSPEASQFLETRKFQKTEIANMYRVPPYMLDPTVTSTWGSGVEEQNRFFVGFTLMPWLVRLEQAFSDLLPGSQFLKFNVDAQMRPKLKDRYDGYAVAVSNGFMSRDEVRSLEDMPPLPDGLGRVFVQPLNVGPVGASQAPSAA